MMEFISLVLATAAAAADNGDGIVAKGSLVLGSGVVSSILTWLAAKRHAEKTAVPQPLAHEQSAYQAHCKDNAADHTNLFSRMAAVEQKVAALDAKFDATFDAIQRQLDSLNKMVTQLFDRICRKK